MRERLQLGDFDSVVGVCVPPGSSVAMAGGVMWEGARVWPQLNS